MTRKANDTSPPPCDRHPDTAAAWFCPACRTMRCRQCVRDYPSLYGVVAVCRLCGGICQPSTSHKADQPLDARGAAIEDAADRRRRILRDAIAPPIVLLTALAVHLAMLIDAVGWWVGLGVVLAWSASSTAMLAMAWWALYRMIGVPFERVGMTLVKLAALAATLQAVRLVCMALTDVHVPRGMFDVFAILLPLAISFVIAPMLICFVMVRGLFELDISEDLIVTAILFLADALLLAIMLMSMT